MTREESRAFRRNQADFAGYQVKRIFKGGRPKAIFVQGKKYLHTDKILEIGWLLIHNVPDRKIIKILHTGRRKIQRVRQMMGLYKVMKGDSGENNAL